jgi:hypothetical protein
MGIMRAFVAVRQIITLPPVDKYTELKQYMEEMFADQNDINEDTRMQLELIGQTLAELQMQKRLEEKPRRRIGFVQEED